MSVRFCCDAQAHFPFNDVVRCVPRPEGSTCDGANSSLLLGGAAVSWPLAARAQQSPMPVIGFLNTASPQSYPRPLSGFLKGLEEAGYVDGRNVAIQYRWAEGHNERLPAMAAGLVQNQVTMIRCNQHSGSTCRKGGDRDDPGRLREQAGTRSSSALWPVSTDPAAM